MVRARFLAEGRNCPRFKDSFHTWEAAPFGYAVIPTLEVRTVFPHMRPTASFLATTRVRFGSSVVMSFGPRLRKAKRLLIVVSNTFAASQR